MTQEGKEAYDVSKAKPMNEEIKRMMRENIRSYLMPDGLPVLSIYVIDDGEMHWFCAESETDALYMHAVDTLGYDDIQQYKDEFDNNFVTVTRLNDDEPLVVRLDDQGLGPIEKTAKEWVEDGKGCIASTVF